MRHLIYLLLACLLFSGVGWGQATDFQRDWLFVDDVDVTLDSTDIETVLVQLPYNRGKATFMAYVWLDDLDEDATHDSLLIQYRPMFKSSKTAYLTNSSGSAVAAKDLQIYNGPAGALTDFDYTTTGADGDNWVDSNTYAVIFDMDGYPWRYIWMTLAQTANDCTTADDSTRIVIEFDVD